MYKNRSCNQEDFSILVCGGINKDFDILNRVLKVIDVTEFPSIEHHQHFLKMATIKSDIFAFVDSIGTYDLYRTNFTFVKTYLNKTKIWKHQYIKFEERYSYSFCSFLNKLYEMGG